MSKEPPEGNINFELIISYLAGELDESGRAEVEQKLAESSEFKAEFDATKEIWQGAGTEQPQLDVDLAWNKVKSRISTVEGSAETIDFTDEARQKRGFKFYAMRIAAVLIVGFGLYSIYLLNRNESVEMVTIATAEKSTTHTLPDGTTVILNANSEITFPKEFGKERLVRLNGEAFFDVKRDEAHPFIISAGEAVVSVLGTSFNVRAYSGDKEIDVRVETGLVEVANREKTERIELEAGMAATLEKKSGKVQVDTVADVNEEFWRTKSLIFRQTEMTMVVATLNSVFESNIELSSEAIMDCPLTATYETTSLDEVLGLLGDTFQSFVIERDGNTIRISGDGCY